MNPNVRYNNTVIQLNTQKIQLNTQKSQKKDEEETNKINELPTEIIIKIFSELDYQDIPNLYLAGRRFVSAEVMASVLEKKWNFSLPTLLTFAKHANRHLKTLNFERALNSKNQLTYKQIQDLVTHCPNIRYLNFNQGYFSSKSLTDDSLMPLTQLSNLRKLNLNFNREITDNIIQHLTQLRLENLDLTDCNITDVGLQYLTTQTSLQSLKLFGNNGKITHLGLEHLQQLRSLTHIDLTALSTPEDDDEDLEELQLNKGLGYLTQSTLQSLVLSQWQKLTNEGIENIAKMTFLQDLIITDCIDLDEENEGNIDFGHLTTLKFLKTLNLSDNEYLTDKYLEQIGKLTTLENLDFSHCVCITDTGLKHLSNLTHLKTLNLRHELNNGITDTGLWYLTILTNLQDLNLSECSKITDAGLRYLTKLTNLQHLNLSECSKITETGLRHLSTLIHLQYIEADILG